MRTIGWRIFLVLFYLSILLIPPAPRVFAQEPPTNVASYARPGETVQTIPSIVYGSDVYHVYFFVTGSLDDPYGESLYLDDPDSLQQRGITALLVTCSDELVTDEETIRKVYLLARTAYKLYRTPLPDEIVPINESLIEQIEGLRRNPIFAAAFIEQNIKALFTMRREEYTEPLRGVLTAQAGVTDPGNEFADDLVNALESSGNIEDAINYAISLANVRKMWQFPKEIREAFNGWQRYTEQGRSYIDTGQGRIEFANGLEVLGLGVRMIWLTDLQQDRSEWLSAYVQNFHRGEAALDGNQAWAVAVVQAETEDDRRRRGDMIRDFVRDQAVDMITEWPAEELAKQWVKYAWKEWGTRNTGYLAAGAAYHVLLGFTIANLLYGMDDIYNNFTTADRADELRRRFRAGRLQLQTADLPNEPLSYDGELAEAYRAAYLLEALSAAQVFRSYADGVGASRLIIGLADLLSGRGWSEAIESARKMADEAEQEAENELGHPPLIDRAVRLTLERLEIGPSPGEDVPLNDCAVLSSPAPLILHPSQSDVIAFDVQNTGNVAWAPHQGYALININDESLGASPTQTLTSEVPPGRIARWVIPIAAPLQAGLKWTEWQMAHNGEPFGPVMSCLVMVVPEGEVNINPGTLLEEWFNELIQQISDEFNELWVDLQQRFEEWLQGELERLEHEIEQWLQQELERLWREFWEELLRQCCGTSALAPATLLLGVWGINHRRRRRAKHGDRD